jgi:hypothetical protein
LFLAYRAIGVPTVALRPELILDATLPSSPAVTVVPTAAPRVLSGTASIPTPFAGQDGFTNGFSPDSIRPLTKPRFPHRGFFASAPVDLDI